MQKLDTRIVEIQSFKPKILNIHYKIGVDPEPFAQTDTNADESLFLYTNKNEPKNRL